MKKGIPMKSSAQEQKHARALAILKETMLQISMCRNPHSSQESLQKLINARLPCLVPYPLYTPNHPPYAQMIITALQELKKKWGSSKVSISKFIKSMHQDLPLAHEHLLTHHLERLVEVGEIISVKKMHTLYTLPTAYSTNKQQEGEQVIMAGGETVRGEMSSYGVDEGPVPRPKKRPVTLIEPVPQPKKRPVTLTFIEPESVGGDDGETKHQDVVTESADFLQTKLSAFGRRRPPKERSSLYTNDGLVVQPKKHPMNLVEPESMGGDDSGTKHTEVPTEPLNLLLNKLTVRGRRKSPEENSKLEQHQNTLVRSSERLQSKAVVVYAVANDDDPTVGYHSPVPQSRGRGRPGKKKFKIKHIQQVGSKNFATQDDTEGMLMLFENQPTTMVEMVKPLQMKLPVRGRGRPPKMMSEVKLHRQEAEKISDAIPSVAAADNEDQAQEERELAMIATADNNIVPLEMYVLGEAEKESEQTTSEATRGQMTTATIIGRAR